MAPDPTDYARRPILDPVEEARVIGHMVLETAISSAHGVLDWFGHPPTAYPNSRTLTPVGWDLYEGKVGIATFLAALGFVTGDSAFREAVQGALAPLRELISSASRTDLSAIVRELGIGGGSGVGSIIMGFTVMGDLLDDRGMHQEGLRLASAVDHTLITSDTHFDVMDGAAGLILALLGLYEATDSAVAIELAEACAAHLLTQQVRCATESVAWKTTWARAPLSGFSHGAAGVALAFARLSNLTNSQRYAETALQSIHYENELFSERHRNWLDLRVGASGCGRSWCHGAPGIALARMLACDSVPDLVTTANVEVAVETTLEILRTNDEALDSFCCGRFGVADVLLEASRRGYSKTLAQEVMASLAVWTTSATREGGFRLGTKGFPHPGLFQGLSGVGYTLLRPSCDALPPIGSWRRPSLEAGR